MGGVKLERWEEKLFLSGLLWEIMAVTGLLDSFGGFF